MDLEYPTRHNVDIVKRLNHLDKLTSKLNLTLKEMPDQDIVTQNHKQKIIKILSNDNHTKLIAFLNKQVISADKQIGIKGSRWNVLHHCAKFNAVQSMKKLLKNIYQDDKNEYLYLINLQTSEGYTPLMLSVIYKSNETMMLILKLGGSDLSLISSNKMRAYDFAINYKNEKAIQQLIVYQNRCKKQLYINEKQLMIAQQQSQEASTCEKFINYMLDCFLCFKRDSQADQNGIIAKINNIIKMNQPNNNMNIDVVKIGSRKDIQDYQIQWKKLSQIDGQKMILFDSIKSLDISQTQFTLKNNLILFQVLCDRPAILRKNIKKKQKVNQNNDLAKYMITMYKNFSAFNIQVDETVPIIKQRGEIMFLSNKNEIWPMLLQKGLAKLYDSYILLNNLNPVQALQQITGFFTKSIPISQLIKNGSVVSYLHQLSLKGYLIVLQANENTQLNGVNKNYYFSILNYYDKGKNPKILLNCPDLINKQKENKESRDLAVIKSHFNKPDQSRIWISQSTFQHFFKNVIICYSKNLATRNQLRIKIKAKTKIDRPDEQIVNRYAFKEHKKSIFFKFKFDKQYEDPVAFQLVNVKTKKKYDLKDVSGWKNEGKQALNHDIQSPQCSELTCINQQIGQYMFMYEFEDQTPQKIQKSQRIQAQSNKGIIKLKREGNLSIISQKSELQREESFKKRVRLNLQPINLKQLLLISWSNEPLHVQYVQEEFGSIQWLSYFKNYCISHWNQIIKKQIKEQYVYETVNDLTILLMYKPRAKKVYLEIEDIQKKIWQQSIMQGKVRQDGQRSRVELIVDQKDKNFFYLVVHNISIQILQQQNQLKFLFQE